MSFWIERIMYIDKLYDIGSNMDFRILGIKKSQTFSREIKQFIHNQLENKMVWDTAT